ncbi:hypothetical protein GQ600_134 [Phytophthora cactorum]|nr:hypothetical protein GQ600_134 [Phytophthora cactorum]
MRTESLHRFSAARSASGSTSKPLAEVTATSCSMCGHVILT